MDERLIEILQEARKKDIINSGTFLIIKDYVNECRLKMKKNEEQVQRLKGQNDQLSLVVATLSSIVNKYIRMQDQADKDAEEKLDREQPKEPKKTDLVEAKTKPKKNK